MAKQITVYISAEDGKVMCPECGGRLHIRHLVTHVIWKCVDCKFSFTSRKGLLANVVNGRRIK